MTDPTTTIAHALHAYARDQAAVHGEVLESWDELTAAGRGYYLGAAGAVVAQPGIAVVALPTETWPNNHGLSFGTDVMSYRDRVLVGTDLDLSPDYARALAAALLAAALAVEAL